MAWNEPGNNNNDPWKNRGGKDQGPPDLDEVFKKFFDKLGGNKGGSGGSSGGGAVRFNKTGIIIAVVALLISYLLASVHTIKEAERGIVLRFGQFYELLEPGLAIQPKFIDQVIPVNVKNINDIAASGFMLTEDENVVTVDMVVQYRVVKPYEYKFNVTDADESLRQALDSAIRYVIGHRKMDDALTSGKEEIRQQVWQELEKVVEPYDMGLQIVDVSFKDARPPEQVKDAFDDAIAAQEDEERFIKEAEAYARSIEPQARGQVERMEQQANAYRQRIELEALGEVARFEQLLPQYEAAPEVTRTRLYLDAMEEVYSNTSKVVVDVEGGGNMMYLPLDKIMQQQNPRLNEAVRNSIDNLRQTMDQNSRENQTPLNSRSSRRSGRN